MTFKDQATDLDSTIYLVYGCVMAVIVSVGILGNFIFLLVLFQVRFANTTNIYVIF